MNQKGFVNIILIIIIVLVGLVGYFVSVRKPEVSTITSTPPPSTEKIKESNSEKETTSTPLPIRELIEKPTDETANWETYRDEKYGFEFKYPKGWSLGKTGETLEIIWLNSPEVLSGDAEISLVIKENALIENILQKEKGLGCYNIISGNELGTQCTYCNVKESNILVDGYSGKELTKINKETQCVERGNCEEVCIDYGVKAVIFQKGNNVFVLHSSGGEPSIKENFEKILLSISFNGY